MNLELDGTTAVVTGAASGLGREVARMLTEEGARVIGFDLAPIEGDGVEGRRVDVGDPASIDEAIAELPAVQVLCNVAGLPQSKPAADILRVNFLGLRHLTEALAPLMGDTGRVVNVASNAGNRWPENREQLEPVLAVPDFLTGFDVAIEMVEAAPDPYIVTKELVQLYTLRRSHTLYRELGVRMNCVSPGEMATPMMDEFRKAVPLAQLEGVEKASTLGRMAHPSEVAPAVVFLASEVASFFSGAIVDVDGGWTAIQLTGQIDYSLFV
jgi:NAD(P)-dependent dehydrogenase (short-subunit alcohol dehydrogenase family)